MGLCSWSFLFGFLEFYLLFLCSLYIISVFFHLYFLFYFDSLFPCLFLFCFTSCVWFHSFHSCLICLLVCLVLSFLLFLAGQSGSSSGSSSCPSSLLDVSCSFFLVSFLYAALVYLLFWVFGSSPQKLTNTP